MGKAVLEGSGKESGLPVEAGCSGVIPNEVVGLGDLRREVELRGNDLGGKVGGEMTLFEEPGTLRFRGAGHHDHGGKMALGVGFVKKGDVGAKPAIVSGSILRLPHPAGANGRMQDLLEFATLRTVGKHNLAKAGTVWSSITIKGFVSKRC